jgi:hypothetical protein
MVKAPGILGVVAFSYGLERVACDLLARFISRMLQTEFLFAFDLYHLGVVHGDFHRAKTQIAQGALDFTQNGGFVLPVNTA